MHYSRLVAGSFAKSDRELLAIGDPAAGRSIRLRRKVAAILRKPQPLAAFAGRQIW
jgi:hypothetical protein